MRKILIAALAVTALSGPALAQSAGAVKYVTVPAAAVMSERLTDLDVYNNGNEKIGEIEDVVIDNNQVVGYVLSVGGFLGLGEHYVVVSPQSVAVTYNQSENKWHAKMDATKDQLKAAPEYKYTNKQKS